MNPHFKALEAAFQLRYYLTFKTQCLKPLFSGAHTLVGDVLTDVCHRRDYHLLDSSIDRDHLRLLVSLQPEQTVSDAVRMLKGNLQNQFRKQLNVGELWAKGYFARSSGTVDLQRVRQYVESQPRHHGYTGNWTKPLKFRNSDFKSPAFSFDHSVSMLNYHFVFATHDRRPVFDEGIALNLFECLMLLGRRNLFSVDRVGVLPDHLHLLMEGVPSKSANDYASVVLNETREWMTEKYWGVLKATEAWNVWQPSYYVGTVGEYTSAQVSSFLRMGSEKLRLHTA
jgi:putative transposase